MSKSWVLLNTSVREGLPTSFLEAGAYGSAIVSSLNPERYPSLFGRFVEYKKFENALNEIINTEECFQLGKKARRHMKKYHNKDKIIKDTLRLYNDYFKL